MLVTTACNRKIRMRLTEVSCERDFQVLSHNNYNYNRRLLKSCHMTDIIIYRIACLLGWTAFIFISVLRSYFSRADLLAFNDMVEHNFQPYRY